MTPLCKGKSIIMWGTCTSGPHVRTFDNGKVKTVFSLRYNQTKNDAGEKISDYIDIESWGNLARYAACVEKGDDILVAGEYADVVHAHLTRDVSCYFMSVLEFDTEHGV